MDVKELIVKYTNSDGVLDFESLQKDIDTHTGSVASKIKKDLTSKFETEKIDLLNQSSKLGETKNETEERLKKLDEEFKTMKMEKEISVFKETAKDLKINDNLIDAFISSGANLSEIDLNTFVEEPIKKLPPVGGDGEDGVSKGSKFDEVAALLK